MARLQFKGLQWLEPPAAYAHGSMKESMFYGCFLMLRSMKLMIHNMSLLQREGSNVLRPAHAI